MDELQDILLETGNTPAPAEVSKGNVSGTAILDAINPIKPSDSNILDFISSTAKNYNRVSSRAPEDNLDSRSRGELLREASNEEYLGGLDYDYREGDARPLISDDLNELQAERQSWGKKALSGLGRAVGEFAINVAEIPGVVGGAIAAGVEQDINRITDNFWVNYTNSLKESLQDALPVYQRKAVTEGGVLDKMTSVDWWSTEGASGAAFMASALIPGLGLAKLPKALSLTRYLAKSGKYAKKVLSQIDEVAVKLGLAEKNAVAAGKGVAAKSAIDLVNVTMANTLFESGVEARGAQEAYKEQAFAKLSRGEISQEQYNGLLAKSGEAASNVFALNMGLLLVPNLIMSKMILGPRTNNLLGIGGKDLGIKLGASNTFEEVTKTAYTGVGKNIINSNITKEVGKSLGRGATNTFREGLVEEAGQGAIEQYWTKGFLDEQVLGERAKGIAKTYTDFLKTTDGQVAVLFGGLLSAGPSAFGYRREKISKDKYRKGMINLFNSSANLYEASKTDFFKRDKDGGLILDKDDNPIVDNAKIAELSAAKAEVEQLERAREAAIIGGNMFEADAIATKLQSKIWHPFIAAGQQGLDSLKEMMTENPATAIAVDEYNRQKGTNITVEQYVQEEMEKAKAHLEDLKYYSKNLQSTVPFSFIREKKLKGEVLKDAEKYRDIYSHIRSGQYLEANAVNRLYQERLKDVNSDISKAEKDGLDDLVIKLKKEKLNIDNNIKEVTNEIKRLTSFKEFEKDWATFYKVQEKTDAINSGEVSDYLNDLISKIKSAKSEEEVEQVVAKAKKDGLILQGVKLEMIPEELLEMANSNNIIESLGAMYTLGYHTSEGYEVEYEKARDNVNGLKKSAEKVINRIIEAAIALEERAAEDRIKHEKLEKEIREINTILNEANNALMVHERSKKSGPTTSLYSELYLKLVKARKDALKTSLSLNKEINKVEKDIIATQKRINSYSTVLKAIANASNNKKLKDSLSKITGTNEELVKTLFESGVMPISLQDILDALYSEKDILIDMVDELEEIVMESSSYTYMKSELSRLNRYRDSLDKMIKKIDKSIKKYEAYTYSKENDLILAELREEVNSLQITILEVDKEIIAIEDHFNQNLFSEQLNLNTFLEGIEEIIQAIEDLHNSEYIEPVKPKFTEKEAKEQVDSIIKEIEDFVFNDKNEEEILAFKNKLLSDIQKQVDNLGLSNSELTNYVNYIFNNLDSKDKLKTFKEFSPEEINFKQRQTNEFAEAKDPTDGKGFDRVPEKMHETFAVMFSSKSVIDKFFENTLKNVYDKEGYVNYDNIAKLALVVKLHPSFGKKLSEDIKEEIPLLQRDIDNMWDDFFSGTIVKEDLPDGYRIVEEEEILPAGDFDTKIDITTGTKITNAPKKKVVEEKEVNEFSNVISTINDTEIKKEVQNIINEKNKELLQERLESIRDLAASKKQNWRTAVGASEAITEGNTVYWDKDTESNSGEVYTILKSTESGGNALILDKKGKLHVVSTMKLTKRDLNVGVTNRDNYEKWLEVRDQGGKFDSVALPIHEKGKPVSILTEEGLSVSRNAFLNYLEETRDKINDPITFSFSPSKLKILIKSKVLLEDAKSKELVEKYNNALNAYNKAIAGEELSKEEINLITNYIPITVRVERAEGPTKVGAGAGTFIPILSDAIEEESYKSIEGALRQSIISFWLQNDRKLGEGKHPGTIEGLSAKWSYVAPGELNVDPSREGTKLTDMKDISYENMEIFAIQDPEHNTAIGISGEIETLSFDQRGKKGLIFLKVLTNTGSPFYLALNQKTLAGTKELDIVMKVLDNFMKEGNKEDYFSELPTEIKEELKKEVPLLYEAFGEEINYGDLLKTIFYSGKEDTQLRTIISTKNHTIKIGDQLWNAQAYKDNRDVIKSILGQKYFRTGFTQLESSNALVVSNKKYLKYLVENKIISSNIKENEPIFAAVPGKGNYLKGVAAYLNSDSLIYDKEIIKKAPIKITDKNVKILPEVRVILQSLGVNPRKLSKANIASLNAKYKKDKKLSLTQKEISDLVNDANKEIGNKEEKECKE